MNSVNLTGNLVKDIELRYTGDQLPVASFTLAVNDKNDRADFIPCKAFGKTAENCNMYLKKGSKAGVSGRWSTGSYEKDGQKIYTHECVVSRVEFLDSKKTTDDIPF